MNQTPVFKDQNSTELRQLCEQTCMKLNKSGDCVPNLMQHFQNNVFHQTDASNVSSLLKCYSSVQCDSKNQDCIEKFQQCQLRVKNEAIKKL